MVQRTSVPLQFHPPSTPSPSYNETSMMSLAVRWQSARFRWAHPSRARPGHPLIFKREALRAPAPKLCRHKYTMIVSEWLSQLSIVVPACWPLPFHRALQTVSTEHEHDKDRSSPGGRGPVTVAVAPNLPCHGSPRLSRFSCTLPVFSRLLPHRQLAFCSSSVFSRVLSTPPPRFVVSLTFPVISYDFRFYSKLEHYLSTIYMIWCSLNV